jgi:hypothetical protein
MIGGDQLVLDFTAGRCEHGDCGKPRTHRAVGAWVRGSGDAPETGVATRECCVTHANYYAQAWCTWRLYPASRDVAWIERIG